MNIIKYLFRKRDKRETQFEAVMKKAGFKKQNRACWTKGEGYWCPKFFLYFRFSDCVEVSTWHPNKIYYPKTTSELKVIIKNKFGLLN